MISTLKEVREALEDLKRQYGEHPDAFWDWTKARAAITKLDALISQEKAEPQYLSIERVEGFPEKLEQGPQPLLYSDGINGCMVRRDDVWLALTSQLAIPHSAPSTSPLTDEQLRDAFEHHWFLTRGKKKFVHELQRHPDQPQIYVADNANRHWVTWQAAHKIGAKP